MLREWPLTERDDQNKQYWEYQDLCDYFRHSILRFRRYIYEESVPKTTKKIHLFLSNTIACNFYASIKYMLLRQCMKVTAGKKDKSWANRVLHLFCFLGLMFDHVAGSNAGRYKYSWQFDQ